jgi:hypothetical protein
VPIFSCSSLNESREGLLINFTIKPMYRDITHTIDSDVAQGSCTIILYVCVGRIKQTNENGDGASVDKLLPVFIWNIKSSSACS